MRHHLLAIGLPLLIAFPLHLAWESAQCIPFFIHPETSPGPFWLIMGIASLGDVALTLITWAAGALAFGSADWYVSKWNAKRWGFLLGIGLLLSVSFEYFALQTARWAYTPLAPIIPGTEISIIPVSQLLFLFPLTFGLARRVLNRRFAERTT